MIVSAIAVLAIGAATRIAGAADVDAVPYRPAAAYVAAGYDWSGFYLGGNVGYSSGRSVDTSSLSAGPGPALFSDTASSRMNGVIGGGQIGLNWQMQSWLWGVEGDFQGTGQKANHSYVCPVGVCTVIPAAGPLLPPLPGPAVPVTLTQQLDWFGTVRGRAGLLVSPMVLLYGTGGLAFGQVDSRATLPGATTASDTHAGWTVGGGVEAAIGGGWTAKVEYLYVDLGKISDTFNSTLVATGGTAVVKGSFSSRVTDNVVRIGFNYNFSSPMISKY